MDELFEHTLQDLGLSAFKAVMDYGIRSLDSFLMFDPEALPGATKSTVRELISAQRSAQQMLAARHGGIDESVSQPEVDLFRRALLSRFPRGISFSSASELLLAHVAGRAISDKVRRAIKAIMFGREDDVWLLPEMVADDTVLVRLVSRANTYLDAAGYFSVDVLRDEFLRVLHNLPDADADFKHFFMDIIAPKLNCDIRVFGGKTNQICYGSSLTEHQVCERVTTHIYRVLQSASDAVSVDSLREQLPFLSVSTINAMIRKMIPAAVELTLDGLDCWKLLDFFYLPEDMSEEVTRITHQLEAEDNPPSAVLIESGLDQVYGGSFCDNFAILDMSVFQQIVSASYTGDEARVWKNHVFRRESDEVRSNVLEDFLQTQTGVFHESEFFDYAKRTRGLTSQGMLILAFLRTMCVRLDRHHWVSKESFLAVTTLSPDDGECISARLSQLLGSQPFLPLGTLPASFFHSLPVFSLNGNTFPWNAYLLTSFCRHCTPSLRVVNDEPSPYTVTAMLIPTDANLSGDVIDYVLGVYQASGMVRGTALDIFGYLKQHQVRMTRSEKLLARIRAKFGVD